MSEILINGQFGRNTPAQLANTEDFNGTPLIVDTLTTLQGYTDLDVLRVGQFGTTQDTSLVYQLTTIGNPPGTLHTWTLFSPGGGGGNLSGTLTAGKLPVATGVNTLGDSALTQTGSDVSASGQLTATNISNINTGDQTYTGTTTLTVGGITAGTVITNEPVQQVLDEILRPYLNPSFASFSISGVSILEVGASLPDTVSFQWTFNNIGNVAANTLDVVDNIITQQILVNISIVSPASYTFSAHPIFYPAGSPKRTTPGIYTFIVRADNTNAIQFTRNLDLSWLWKYYAGSSTNLTLSNSQVLALPGAVSTVFPNQIFVAAGEYLHLLIPTDWIQPVTFKDHATGFAIAMNAPILQSVTNINSIAHNYYDYCSTNQLINATTIDVSL